ncbi:MAG: transglycosylase SLT domain-containing protein, partial [Myxococcota bacterium]
MQRARLLTVAFAFLSLAAAVAPRRAAASPDFPVPPTLRPTVNFWIDVFAKYGRRQIVIHDTERVDRVYSVLDFRDLERAGYSDVQIELTMRDREESEKARVRGILRRLDQLDPSTDAFTEEEERIYGLFGNDRSPTKFIDAAGPDRVRGQKGIRERFAQGIQTGHAYFPHMEAIFRQAGVPTEITRLPLIESCFNMRAYSKVGAAGVWQFMPGTARSYMRVDGTIDERLDPLVASRAAARFMRQNYEKLGSWPLAINAYNHGPAGMARAVSSTGTSDIARIIQNYRGPAYKFASRNFYPEFLAAIEIEANHRRYFGELALHPPYATDTVYLAQRTHIGSAARCAGADVGEIAALNPSLLPVVHQGRAPIPPGFGLRVPVGSAARFD